MLLESVADRVLVVDHGKVWELPPSAPVSLGIYEFLPNDLPTLPLILKTLPGVKLDVDHFPWRIIAPLELPAEQLLARLSESGLKIRYWRDLTHSVQVRYEQTQ